MIDTITIYLNDVCGNHIYTRADGRILYDKIKESLDTCKKVIVQFDDREIASESFLDEAIVEHYFGQKSEDIENRIILRGVTKPDQILLGTIFEYRKRLENKEAKKSAKRHKRSVSATAV
ncbi:MAG: STAS-like domain-containing protein [Smithellaceae bacterium]